MTSNPTNQTCHQSTDRDKLLGESPIGRLMWRLAIPSVLAQVINILYNIVDRIYVGHIPEIGKIALTGLGVSAPLILIIAAFSALISGGAAPLAAISLGEKNKEEGERYLGNSVMLLGVLTIILMIAGYLFMTPILRIFGASDLTLPFAQSYTSLYLIGTPFVMFALGLNSFISCQGEAKRAMISVLIGAIANIILDPIFIFLFGLGIRGAALATVLSQMLSALYVMNFLISEKSGLRIKRENIKFYLPRIRRILSLGVSSFVMNATESAIMIVFNRSLLFYGGDLHVGAMTVGQSLMQLIVVPLGGFTHGIQPIISYNFGAENYERVDRTMRRSVFVTMVISIMTCVPMLLAPSFFGSFFTSDAELLALIGKVLPVYVGGIWLFGLQMSAQGFFVGTGKAGRSLFLALFRKVILLIPLALILPNFMGVIGVYWAEPIADFTSASTAGVLLYLALRQMKREPRKVPLSK